MSNNSENQNGKAKDVLRNEKGQGLVEYALILVLIAIVAIAAVTNVGTSTKTTFSNINNKISAGNTANP
jgi:pilus assembly protein Flp/PilA